MDKRVERAATLLRDLAIQQLNLPKNLKKGGWGHLSTEYFLRRAEEELEEVGQALCEFRKQPTDENLLCLLAECGDVAAFLAMVAERYKRLTREGGA